MIEFHRHLGRTFGEGDPGRRRPSGAKARAAPRPGPRVAGLRSADVAIIAIGVGFVAGFIMHFALHLG